MEDNVRVGKEDRGPTTQTLTSLSTSRALSHQRELLSVLTRLRKGLPFPLKYLPSCWNGSAGFSPAPTQAHPQSSTLNPFLPPCILPQAHHLLCHVTHEPYKFNLTSDGSPILRTMASIKDEVTLYSITIIWGEDKFIKKKIPHPQTNLHS